MIYRNWVVSIATWYVRFPGGRTTCCFSLWNHPGIVGASKFDPLSMLAKRQREGILRQDLNGPRFRPSMVSSLQKPTNCHSGKSSWWLGKEFYCKTSQLVVFVLVFWGGSFALKKLRCSWVNRNVFVTSPTLSIEKTWHITCISSALGLKLGPSGDVYTPFWRRNLMHQSISRSPRPCGVFSSSLCWSKKFDLA